MNLSLHHIHKHPRDDLRANLVMLCGDGVQGCHGQIELGNRETKRSLAEYIANERRDTFLYLQDKLGGREQAIEWVRTQLLT